MADTKVSAFADGVTAIGTDRIPIARSPFGVGDNAYITPAYIITLGTTTYNAQYDAIGAAAAAVAAHVAAADPHPQYLTAAEGNAAYDALGAAAAAFAAAVAASQPLDADLTAIAALDGTAGYLVKTAANTYARRTLTGTVGVLSITNGDGTTGNPVFSIDDGAITYARMQNISATQRILGRNTAGAGVVEEVTIAQLLDWIPTIRKRSFGIVIDGGGSAITTGIKGDVVIPYTGTITGWTILGDQSGSIVIDVWKDTYANYPPTVADTIAGTEKPTISTATKGQDNALSSWTTAVTAGDIVRFNVDSITTLTRVTLIIEMILP